MYVLTVIRIWLKRMLDISPNFRYLPVKISAQEFKNCEQQNKFFLNLLNESKVQRFSKQRAKQMFTLKVKFVLFFVQGNEIHASTGFMSLMCSDFIIFLSLEFSKSLPTTQFFLSLNLHSSDLFNSRMRVCRCVKSSYSK